MVIKLFGTIIDIILSMVNRIKIILLKFIKSNKGQSLAEFAVTTALMATLAATAAPKLSELSKKAKAEKSLNEIDKILTQARNFYQRTARDEGRGRFPGQDKYNLGVGDYPCNGCTINDDFWGDYGENHPAQIAWENILLEEINQFEAWDDEIGEYWRSVFGVDNSEAPAPPGSKLSDDGVDCTDTDCFPAVGADEWVELFGGNTLKSKYQDGHFAYAVIPGALTGDNVFPPVLYVIDLEKPGDFYNMLAP